MTFSLPSSSSCLLRSLILDRIAPQKKIDFKFFFSNNAGKVKRSIFYFQNLELQISSEQVFHFPGDCSTKLLEHDLCVFYVIIVAFDDNASFLFSASLLGHSDKTNAKSP